MSVSLKHKSLAGFSWNFLDKLLNQIVQFLLSIVLARLLIPENYGVVGLAYVVISLVNCLLNTGMNASLIRAKEAKDKDFYTYFWVEFGLRTFCFILIFIAAPFVANYYQTPILCSIIRWLALATPLMSFTCVQNIILARSLNFRTTCGIGIFSSLISGLIAVVAAWKGVGVWALVIQNLVGNLLYIVLINIKVPWFPRFIFSGAAFVTMFHFGYKLFLSGILNTVYNNIYSLIIGKWFSVKQLGFYTKGHQIPAMAVESVNGPIGSVIYPALSKLQDDPERFRQAFQKGLLTTMFIIIPMLWGMAACAHSLLFVLFGEKWLPATFFLQVVAISYAFFPMHTFNLQAIMALGRSDTFLYLEFIKKIYSIIIIICVIPYGIYPLVMSVLICTVISIFVNSYPLRKLIDWGPLKQLGALFPTIISAGLMGICVWGLGHVPLNKFLLLPIQILSGILLYLLFSFCFNRRILIDSIKLCWNFISPYLARKNA